MSEQSTDVDVVVVGAGFAGLYLLHRLRAMGLSAQGIEKADGVGGTWYWNRYPGARCDVESIDYSYSFDAELDAEWKWKERYATQPEILSYLEHVADRFDLRRDIRFETRMDRAEWNDAAEHWAVHVTGPDGTADTITCRHHVMASGCLSVPKEPEYEGADQFAGPIYVTGRWPHEPVDFSGQRVAVIGTGSSGIQSIPLIAQQAAELTVLQRTPNYSIPAHNGPHPADKVADIEADRAAYREAAKWSRAGVTVERSDVSALSVSEEERNAAYEEAWQVGGLFQTSTKFSDLGTNKAANDTISDFIRGKINDLVDDPDVADLLSPTTYPFATKRPCLDDGYYQTFNLPHVSLVDLHTDPIEAFTPSGLRTSTGERAFDVIVMATGFDAMTGALVGVDIRGRDGQTLAEAWENGPETYLGLMSVGFPNLWMITGPQSPSVLSNMVVSIEQHVDWICEALAHLDKNEHTVLEPMPMAQAAWRQHVIDFADLTLLPLANSWYMGANVPGKPRVVLPYVGGVDTYRQICNEAIEQDFLGFRRSGPGGVVENDGLIRPLKPDVQVLLDTMAEMGVPAFDTLSAQEARDFVQASAAMAPPGREVGEVLDGVFPGADGVELDYRLYRPDTEGPHSVVLYFHGGGWVLGDATANDAFCRWMCAESGSMIVSVDYRHAPEARFPAAVDDAVAALDWIDGEAEALGGRGDGVTLMGWSAGGNLAAVIAQAAGRSADGPNVRGQVLITPVTDASVQRPSMSDNGEGYILTKSLMDWFYDHYLGPDADPAVRSDERLSPLLAEDLACLPPTMVVTAEFDPLRDEGNAYAAALEAAGVDVELIEAPGQIHTAFDAVGVLPSPNDTRAAIAAALRRFA